MRFPSILMMLLLLCSSVDPAWAGGAVAATQQRKQAVAQQQVLMQQAIMQRQVMLETDVPIGPPETVEEVVDITQLWKLFEKNSEAWSLIIDEEAKVMTVAHFAEQLGQQGIQLRQPPQHYAAMIDTMSQQSSDVLTQPFDKVLSLVAILEYDYGNGEDPDALALRFLGRERYLENRQRLGLPVQ